MLKIVVEEHMSKEREKAINQVAESVTELADIFKEIQVGDRGRYDGEI